MCVLSGIFFLVLVCTAVTGKDKSPKNERNVNDIPAAGAWSCFDWSNHLSDTL
jgi:hypothetical protein